jgi:glycerol uptake operon antiterminator
VKQRRTLVSLQTHLTKPVIPYLTERLTRDPGDLAAANVLFVGGGELADLPAQLKALSREPLARLPVFLHIDLVEGLASDDAGLRYVATLDRLDGIITVRPHLATLARKLGLKSILRLFLQDGRAVDRGLQVIERSQPDAIELLPGVAFLEVSARFCDLDLPVIAGGLIRAPETVHKILAAGANAVSTTNRSLWAMNRTA